MKKLFALLMSLALVAAAQGSLAITNGDFEADAAQTYNVTNWYDTVTANTSNWWESTWAGPTVSPNGTSVLGLSYMFTTTNWAYQSIGVNDAPLSELYLSFDVGSFTDAGGSRDLGVTVSIFESDGSFVPADNTAITGAAGITLVDSISVLNTLDPGMMTSEVVMLDLSSAGTGDLFLQFENYVGQSGEPWTAIDNVRIVPEPATMALLALGGLAIRRRA